MLVRRTEPPFVPAFADAMQKARYDVIDQRAGTERERAAFERRLDAGGIESFGGVRRRGYYGFNRLIWRSQSRWCRLIDKRLERESIEARDFGDAVTSNCRAAKQSQTRDVVFRIESLLSGGSLRFYSAVSPLPCPKKIGRQPGSTNDDAHWVPRLAVRSVDHAIRLVVRPDIVNMFDKNSGQADSAVHTLYWRVLRRMFGIRVFSRKQLRWQ